MNMPGVLCACRGGMLDFIAAFLEIILDSRVLDVYAQDAALVDVRATRGSKNFVECLSGPFLRLDKPLLVSADMGTLPVAVVGPQRNVLRRTSGLVLALTASVHFGASVLAAGLAHWATIFPLRLRDLERLREHLPAHRLEVEHKIAPEDLHVFGPDAAVVRLDSHFRVYAKTEREEVCLLTHMLLLATSE